MKPESFTEHDEAHETGMGAYVDALSDCGFRRIFAEEHQDILIDFLNELLKSNGKQIVELYYDKNGYGSLAEDECTPTYSLICKDKSGERFAVMVQRGRQEDCKDRMVFYAFNAIHTLAHREPQWQSELPEVYFIGLLDFTFEDSDPGAYIDEVQMLDGSGNVFFDKPSWILLEIPAFNKGLEELKTGLDKWLYVLKNLGALKDIPLIFRNTILQKVFTIADIANLTKEDYMRYTKEQMELTDRYAILESAREKGWEEGRQEGREEGQKKGRQEEREKIIRSLLESGKFTTGEVAAYASASESVVEKIKKSMQKD